MRRLLAAVALSLALLPLPAARAAVPVVFIDGRGFGHGVGMAQDGAFWMGKAGATTPAILAQFYPGTTVGKGAGAVRVAVHTAASLEAVVGFPTGGEVRDAPTGAQSEGFPLAVRAGEQVRIRVTGSTYTAEVLGGNASQSSERWVLASSSQEASTTTAPPTPTLLPPPSSSTTTTTTAAPPPPTAPSTTTAPAPPSSSAPRRASSSRTLWSFASSGGVVTLPARNRQYRGGLEATAAPGALRIVNQVDVETYLKGMGEVRDPSWPPAALRAQAIAARTYALRATAAGAELCDDQRCQVYLGAQAEYAAMNKAVNDSAGQVLTHNKRLASAVYSANGGGHSASTEEGFGTVGSDFPYLRPATYPTQDPTPWSTTIALKDVASRLGYAGEVTDVRIVRAGPSGRAVEVALDGSAGLKVVTGLSFDASLGLRSTLFSLRVGTSDTAPPPPGDASLLQLPPDAVAAVTAENPPVAIPELPAAPRPLQGAGRPRLSDDARLGLLSSAAAALTMAVAAAWSLLASRPPRRWAHLRRRWVREPRAR